MPPENVNVYSILQQGHLLISQDALQDIVAKLHTPIFRGPIDRARWAAEQARLAALRKLPETAEGVINAPTLQAEAPAVAV